MLSIRRYNSKDLKSVKELYYFGLEQFDADLRTDGYLGLDDDLDDIENVYINDNGEFLVATIDSQLVAMGALKKISAIRGEIKRISVQPDYQRHGCGQIILVQLINIAAKLGYQEPCLDTTVQNIPAQKLYEKFGFRQCRRAKIGRLDVIFYEKTL